MCPSLSYDEALTHVEIAPLSVHHSNFCATLLIEILSDSDHRLRALLPPLHHEHAKLTFVKQTLNSQEIVLLFSQVVI